MKITYPIRINKYLALKNLSTRKGADDLIKKGLVFVNKKKAILGQLISQKDIVSVDDKNKIKYVYYAYNKPIGISTNKEPNTKDILKVTKFDQKVFPIGRLDKDSSGLIILTNDGRVTDRLLSPKYVHEKEYEVKLELNFSDRFLELMSKGVKFDRYLSRKCKVWRKGNSKTIFHIILTEGKKRQIRRMSEALHHKVINLKRIRIMNIELGKIKQGEWREIKEQELETFLKSLNLK